ncbi:MULTISPECIES: AMP-binding protein [unclassified Oceanispirochaeta]|uniref:AMP-binding protein n=1 Tax=unclassified Oceanispirochaeta TaxID=2635722 RepID=UPI000E09CF5F|nr:MULTISPECIES: AMP-binding protein [unclassified Oceanispirochaeta]MBF9015477.1 acyl-CoA synthetase [Oceanispirochaeta sp. M2]NPD71936.1 acyl-CoA synthetase [Oceanispirochaeta sp. M1]RDG32743.1 hypothetical protein DV872_07480 [Oceanispirochaeta sp. M1]
MIFAIEYLQKVWASINNPVFTTKDGDVYWPQFHNSVLSLSRDIQKQSYSDWGLYFDNPALFSIAFLALLHSGKTIHLFPVLPEESGSLPLLTDKESRSVIPVEIVVDPDTPVDSPSAGTEGLIVLHTSGSTGQAKRIIKKITLIERELQELFSLWSDLFRGSKTYTTVSHQHIYGLLFSILLPLISGATIFDKKLAFPESLLKEDHGNCNLIASPAFLKRLREMPEVTQIKNRNIRAFSSGGFLPPSVAENSSHFFSNPVTEIYGSTETGGIAWKKSPGDKSWKIFDCVQISQNREGQSFLTSEYIDEKLLPLDDSIELLDCGNFILHGRQDSIVKVEDKRVSLNEIENKLLESEFLADAVACLMDERRQYIAVVLQLNPKGELHFKGWHKKDMNRWFREWLSPFFHPTILPKKWRYPESIPRNSQGKISRKDIVVFFDKPENAMREMIEKSLVDLPDIVSSSFAGNSYESVLSFPENYRYFEGHFPEMKILPALAMFDWVIKIMSDQLESSLSVVKIPRMKFKNPIFPNQSVKLSIKHVQDQMRINFDYRNAEDNTLLSSGKIHYEVLS